MTRNITTYAYVAVSAAVVITSAGFVRAFFAYAELRDKNDAVTKEQLQRASDGANFWFIAVMVALGMAVVCLAHSNSIKHRARLNPAS